MFKTVREKIQNTKIKKLQLDPFGFCNAKCWFCPVKYRPQPKEGSGVMPVSLIEKIFADIDAEKRKPNGVVQPNFDFFTTAHYNEILLYKHVEDLFKLARKYKFETYVMSNGISLHPKNVDLIAEYPDVVIHVGLNIPAFEKDLWASRSGFSPDQFDRLMSNLEYAKQKLKHIPRNDFKIIVNGLSEETVRHDWATPGSDLFAIGYDLKNELDKQYQLALKLFPEQSVIRSEIFDRAGTVKNVVSNENWIKSMQKGKKVVGCYNANDLDRTSEWIHVNSAGQVFLCCNDYDFDYQFGDLNTQSIAEVWNSDLHIQVIEKAFKEICTNCMSAVLEDDVSQNQPVLNRGAAVTEGMRFSRR